MKKFIAFMLFLSFTAVSTLSVAQCSSHEGQARQVSNAPDIVEIAIGSKVHKTLVAAVQAAGLVETLQSEGPFTVFAPTDDAFNKLPSGTVENLLKPANKEALAGLLTYHVLAGKYSAEDIITSIKANSGEARFQTVSGGTITASLNDHAVVLEDEKGNISRVTAADLKASNGVVHVVDTVVLPR